MGTVLITAAFAILVYCTPMMVAGFRHHRQATAIAALNLSLGWTVIGWVAALVWALTADVKHRSAEDS